MKNTRGGSVLTRVITTTAALSLAFTVACSKKDAAGDAAPSTPAAKASAPLANSGGVVSAEKTTFNEVTAHLDPGGSLYGYFSTAQWLDGLSGKVDGVRDVLLKSGLVTGTDREQMSEVLTTLTGIIRRSGVEGVTGVGVSGIALEPGFYQTKLFVHRAPGSEKGYLWTLPGAEARPLGELDWLPANTALAMFGDLDLAGIWSMMHKELANAGVADAVKELDNLDKQVETATGHALKDLLGSLGGEQGIFLTLNPNRMVNVPVPDLNEPLEVPEPGLAIMVKVKDDRLFDLLDGVLKNLPNVTSTDENGIKMRSMPSPLPVPMTLQPTLARWGDYLVIATTEDMVKNLAEVKSGKAPGLKADPEFMRLSKGLATKGNQFSYVSDRLSAAVQDVQKKMMAAQQTKETKAMTDVVEQLFGAQQNGAFYSVGGQLEDGWLVTMRGHQNPSMMAAIPAVGAGGMLAAIAIPNFVKAKATAQSTACMNNVKQVCLAAHMYADEHNGRLPTGLDEYETFLGSPQVLVCPSVTGSTVPNYKLMKRGGALSELNGATTVLIECPIHGTKGFVDGHVEAGKKH